MELMVFKSDLNENYCFNCGEYLEAPKTFVVFTEEKYHGANEMASHTATLIIEGKSYAFAYIEKNESDAGGDVAYLQLSYIPKEKRTEEIVKTISDFAKWIKFEWKSPDKQSEFPTLVRLIGIKTDKKRPLWYEIFIVLQNAMKITIEHLEWEATSKEI